MDFTLVEALKKVYAQLKKWDITVVLSDVVMPVMNELDRGGIIKIIGRTISSSQSKML